MIIFLLASISSAYAQEINGNDALGQVIKINTRFHYFVGKPQWLLIIRDLDHGQVIPYLYDIQRTENVWFAFTMGRNYLITVSNLQFAPYRSNPYKTKTIKNFCGLESNGRIIRNESMDITITGDLTPDTNTFTCDVLRYTDANFTIVDQPSTAAPSN